jgi:hypothetical protein
VPLPFTCKRAVTWWCAIKKPVSDCWKWFVGHGDVTCHVCVTNVEYVGGMGDRLGLGLGLGFYQFDSFGEKMYGS